MSEDKNLIKITQLYEAPNPYLPNGRLRIWETKTNKDLFDSLDHSGFVFPFVFFDPSVTFIAEQKLFPKALIQAKHDTQSQEVQCTPKDQAPHEE